MNNQSKSKSANQTISRREFVVSMIGMSSLIFFKFPKTFFTKDNISPEQAREIYRKSIVIDCLASPSSFNIPWPPPGPLTRPQLQNVVESGITAINATVSSTSFEKTIRNIAFWHGEIDRHSNHLQLIKKYTDIKLAKERERLGLILGFQHSEMFGRDLTLLNIFHKLGVRIIQLTYNKRNLLGDGCLEPGNGGLSNLGRKAVEKMNDLGIAVDLSHCNTQTTADGIKASPKPIIISHSGCREVYQHPRNKEDWVLRAMAKRGGVIGIYLMPFLGNNGTPYANKEMLLNHIEHALNVCGSDHVGIGSDLSITPVEETPEYVKMYQEITEKRKNLGIQAPDEQGRAVYIPDLNHPRRLEGIAVAMAKRGHSANIIEKVIGSNFNRVFREIWQ